MVSSTRRFRHALGVAVVGDRLALALPGDLQRIVLGVDQGREDLGDGLGTLLGEDTVDLLGVDVVGVADDADRPPRRMLGDLCGGRLDDGLGVVGEHCGAGVEQDVPPPRLTVVDSAVVVVLAVVERSTENADSSTTGARSTAERSAASWPAASWSAAS